MRKRKNKLGQVWVETVIYTLIGLAIIGILLGVSKPKIDEMKDKFLIEQIIESLNNIDLKINEVQKAPGNVRIIDLKISKGRFVIDAAEDLIYWEMDSKYKYSEPGVEVSLGNLKVLTEKAGPWKIKISSEYEVDLVYNEGDEKKEFDLAPVPYSFSIQNLGEEDGSLVINIAE